jgi:hypothetical protein
VGDAWCTILDDGAPVEVPALVGEDAIRLSAGTVRAALGWEAKPEGLCRDDRCVPWPSGVRVGDGRIDLADLAATLGRPLALDLPETAAYLGAAAADRAQALASLVAPDFSLPDLDGRQHALSDHRGCKVFLVAYASW